MSSTGEANGVLDRLDVVMVDGIEPGWVRNVNRPQDLSS